MAKILDDIANQHGYVPPDDGYAPGTTADGPWGSITALQEALVAAGFDPGPIDGIMGPLTRAAMGAFKASIGGTGFVLSANDWAVLQETSAEPPLPGNLPDDGTGSGYLTESWLAQIPELKAFIDEWAVKFEDEDFPPDSAMARDLENDFLNALMKTDWWKSSSGSWRVSEQMRIEDPASWELQRDINRKDVKMIATALGYPLNDKEIEWFANFVARTGATNIEIQRAIMDKKYYDFEKEGDHFIPGRKVGVGSIRGEYDRLKEFARDNLISIRDERLWEYAHDINSEKRTTESVDQIINDFTKVRYDFLQPDFIDRLHESGQTISDYLNPVRDAVASVWEIDPRELSLTNEWFSDNLLVNEDGTERFINTREARLLAHQDERYKSTDAFKGKMSNFSNSVMQAFGAV